MKQTKRKRGKSKEKQGKMVKLRLQKEVLSLELKHQEVKLMRMEKLTMIHHQNLQGKVHNKMRQVLRKKWKVVSKWMEVMMNLRSLIKKEWMLMERNMAMKRKQKLLVLDKLLKKVSLSMKIVEMMSARLK